MLTTDLSLRVDPAYEKISRRFLDHPDEFADAFAPAWFKLTHRDMGPIARYLGPLVPKEQLIWQDPVPAVDHELINDKDIEALKAKVLASGLSISQLVTTAWASAEQFPRQRQAWRCEWCAHPARSAEGLGSEPARRTRQGARETRIHSEGFQFIAAWKQEGLSGRSHRARRARLSKLPRRRPVTA